MSSIDDFFKKPILPSQKRKLEPIRDPNQVYKSPKLQGSDSARSASTHAATVEDETEDVEDEDMEAGPEMPPDFDEEDQGEDEDGRFFGGGVTGSTVDAINYLNAADGEEEVHEEKIDIPWLRRTALGFEKKINKNAELRAKFESDPQKFIGSEADLDSEIKSLSILSEHPELYIEFAKLGCTGSLVGLLAHDNTDIAIDAVQVINELIDDDVQADDAQWNALVDGFVEADLLDLLLANLGRLDEEETEGSEGVYYILAIVENLASRAVLADRIGKNKELLSWILERARRAESQITQNKQSAAEVCSILLQMSAKCRDAFVKLDGVEVFLQLTSAYRKQDPDSNTEEEYMENLFDSLACVVDDEAGKAKFIESEGIELCLIMVRGGKQSKEPAFRVLDHSMGGPSGRAACEAFVEAAGLKPLFTNFMKEKESEVMEHILDILASMLQLLPADSAPRIRLLAKFVEKEYQKIMRLFELRKEYATRVQAIDKAIAQERAEMSAEEAEEMEGPWLSRRLDGGLSMLQSANTVLAWVAAEDEGAYRKIESLCDMEDVRRSLREQAEEAEGEVKEMLTALVRAI